MVDRNCEYRKTSSLTPHPSNVCTQSGEQINHITASIKEFGFTNPVLIDENDAILAGHAHGGQEARSDEVSGPTSERPLRSQETRYVLADTTNS